MKMCHVIYTSGETKHVTFCQKILLNSKCFIIINF